MACFSFNTALECLKPLMDGSWLVTQGSWLMARDSRLVAHGSWLVTRGSWLMAARPASLVKSSFSLARALLRDSK